jgi:hypothetical protein
MHPNGLDAHRWLGPLTDPAFVRRAALEREGLPEHDRVSPPDRSPLRWKLWLAAVWSRCVDGARPRPHRQAGSAQPRKGEASDQGLR